MPHDDETTSGLESSVLWHIRNLTTLPTEPPALVLQYRLPGDKRPFDFAWPDKRLALEVDGGIWTNGAHTRGKGKLRDDDKTNYAAACGWRVMRFNTNFQDDPMHHLTLLVEAYNYEHD